MAISMRGDFAQLRAKIAGLSRMAQGKATRQIAIDTARIGFELAKRSASAGANPQGRRWKLKADGSRALVSAGSSLAVIVSATGFRIIVPGKPWYRFQQKGAKRRGTKWKLPARRILPKKWPPKLWQYAMTAAAREALLKVMK